MKGGGEAERLRGEVARLKHELQRQAGRHGAAMDALRRENADLRRLCAALEERLRRDPGSGSGVERLMRTPPSANPRRKD